jgi:hypothetical protein
MLRIALILTVLLAPQAALAQASTKLPDAIERMLQRLGGSTALAGVRSLSIEADCRGPGGEFTTRVDSFRPGHAYFRQVHPERTTEVWSTPDRSWARGADGTFADLAPAVRSFVRGHEFHLLLFEIAERFSNHRDAGDSADVGCSRVTMTDEDGRPAEICVAADGLPQRLELNPPGAEGAVVIRFADWTEQDGAHYFRSFELTEGSEREFSCRYRTIEPNAVSALRFVPPATGGRAEQDAILAILRADRRAHLETDAGLIGGHLADELVEVSGGEIRTQTREEVVTFFTQFFQGATYEMWEDARPPEIRVSADWKMAWVARKIRARRMDQGPTGTQVRQSFESAYTATYEKRDGGWKMTSVTSTFATP